MSIEDENNTQSEEKTKKDYEILRADFPNFDINFKIIVIGNSGKFYFIYNK